MTDTELTELNNARKWVWRGLIALALTAIVLMGVNYGITVYKVQQSERTWCKIIEVFNDSYARNPPTTPAGQTIRDQFLQMSRKFGCRVP